MQDEGTYVCRAYNDKVSITGSVVLSIQSRPVFTISIGDMHVDERDDVTWTCEAFGIPVSNLSNGLICLTNMLPNTYLLLLSRT